MKTVPRAVTTIPMKQFGLRKYNWDDEDYELGANEVGLVPF
jgi:hypothetical protein